jgi:hypothetical protein
VRFPGALPPAIQFIPCGDEKRVANENELLLSTRRCPDLNSSSAGIAPHVLSKLETRNWELETCNSYSAGPASGVLIQLREQPGRGTWRCHVAHHDILVGHFLAV